MFLLRMREGPPPPGAALLRATSFGVHTADGILGEVSTLRSGVAPLLVLLALALPAPQGEAAATADPVLVTEVDGPITPVVAVELAGAVDEAEAAGAVLVVRIDTPGGLDTSMRDIVQTFLNAPVPVVAYVAPEGARAASAGTFITMAAHVAAMAPATSIGAATPVDLQGGEITDKVINDAASFAVTVAERRGRDAAFAEAAVREGASITADEAVSRGVVDLGADDLDALLEEIDGTVVDVDGRPWTLATAGASVDDYEMTTFRRILGWAADPNLAFVFISIGTLAIVYEAANPGMGFAGVAGAIALILGFFSLSVLPVNVAGIALLVLAAALFVGEVFVPGVGVLAAGGTAALLASAVFLFDGPLAVSVPILWPTAAIVGGGTIVAGRLAMRARSAAPASGPTRLVGEVVTVSPKDDRHGDAFVDGAWWTVVPEQGSLRAGPAEIVSVDGLRLVVRPTGDPS